MNSSKYHLGQNNINGQRPSPLRISKESHLIRKSSSSCSSASTSNSSSSIEPPVSGVKQQQQKNQPVIIYTHSPKVIHTQAKDFMALVQKLTGLSPSNNQEMAPPAQQGRDRQGAVSRGLTAGKGNGNERKRDGHDYNDSPSTSAEENYHAAAGAGGGADIVVSSLLKPPHAPYFADAPLFTPTPSDLFYSPRLPFRCPNSVFASPKMGNPISPSVLEFIKGLPEY
uniref:VQ domain-containing protein n=1 Tax=Salix viminalis TaxID=40686 RepID=A0A6N2N454_SALVM